MAKFKIGDKVVIKDGSNIKGYVGGWYMSEYINEIGEIVKIINAPNDMMGYKVKLDCTDKLFIYDERGLEKMTQRKIIVKEREPYFDELECELVITGRKRLSIRQLRELELMLEQQNTNDRLEQGQYRVDGNYALIDFSIDCNGDIIY